MKINVKTPSEVIKIHYNVIYIVVLLVVIFIIIIINIISFIFSLYWQWLSCLIRGDRLKECYFFYSIVDCLCGSIQYRWFSLLLLLLLFFFMFIRWSGGMTPKLIISAVLFPIWIECNFSKTEGKPYD